MGGPSVWPRLPPVPPLTWYGFTTPFPSRPPPLPSRNGLHGRRPQVLRSSRIPTLLCRIPVTRHQAHRCQQLAIYLWLQDFMKGKDDAARSAALDYWAERNKKFLPRRQDGSRPARNARSSSSSWYSSMTGGPPRSRPRTAMLEAEDVARHVTEM